ncbi:hypothetical protein F4814DRAFT_456166 [Daldinia grandis]|nr:hypothetical protein F4814DRAFT_456166 [Daldinia grandis]
MCFSHTNNLGAYGTCAALHARNSNRNIYQRTIPGTNYGEQDHLRAVDEQITRPFLMRTTDRYGRLVGVDINPDEEDLNDRRREYPTHLNSYLNYADSSNSIYGAATVPVRRRSGVGVDLRRHLSEAYDQRGMNSCATLAVAGAFEFAMRKAGKTNFIPSKLYIWYYARLNSLSYKGRFNGVVDLNDGTAVEDALRVLSSGVCPEAYWPYEPGQFNTRTNRYFPRARAATEPDARAKSFASQYTATYKVIGTDNLHQNLIRCLNSGFPFLFSMNLRNWLDQENFSRGNGWKMVLPARAEEDEYIDGWHSFLAVGYIPQRYPQGGFFIVRNSWGPHWGDRGHFYMAFDHMSAYCQEFYTVRPKSSPRGLFDRY